MKLAEAYVEVKLDTKKAKQQAQGEVESLGKGLGSTFAKVFSAAALGAGIAKSVDAASDLNETVSKTQVVFGKSGAGITKWADDSAKSFGLSKRAALDAVDTFAIFGQGAGLAGTDLEDFSKQLVGLSSDLASFYNTSPEDAINAIGAALRGESEPIRAYGVLLDDATLKQRAMTMGLYDGKGALDQHSRVLAAQAEILAQTGKAQGDFARTSDGLANSQRIAAAEAENSAASLGQNFLPIYQKIVEVVGFLANRFGDLPGPVQVAVVALAGLVILAGPIKKVVETLDIFSKAVQKVVTDSGGLKSALTKIGPAAAGLGAIVAAAATIYTVYSNNKHAAAERTKELSEALLGEKDAQKDALTALAEGDFHVKQFLDTQHQLGVTTDQLTQFIKNGTGPVGDLVDAFNRAGGESGDWTNQQRVLRDELGLGNDASQAYLTSIRQFILEAGDLKGVQDEHVATQELVNEVTGEGTETTTRMGEAARDGTKATKDQTTATDAQVVAQAKQNDGLDDLVTRLDNARQATEDLYDAERSAIDSKYRFEKSTDDAEAALARLNTALTDHKSTLEDVDDASRDAADAAIKMSEDYATLNGASLNSRDGVLRQIDSLTLFQSTLAPESPLRTRIQEYIDDLKRIPQNVATELRLTTVGGGLVHGRSAAGRFVPGGSNFLTTTGERGGRTGDEAILPLGDRRRLQQLLGDPRVGPRVADALGMDSGGGSTVTKSVTFTGDIVSPVDFDGAWRMANFFLAGLN